MGERQKSGLSTPMCWGQLKVIYLFTSFSGHRPGQRECARTGLRSHARCNPYPIPQPVKVGHTTGVYDPYSFRIVMWVLLRPTRTNQWNCCETGHTVFCPYPRRLSRKSNYLQMSLQRQHFLLSYLKTLIVGPAGVWTRDLPSIFVGTPSIFECPVLKHVDLYCKNIIIDVLYIDYTLLWHHFLGDRNKYHVTITSE